MAKKQSGLGKGLGALMLENNTDSMVSTDTLAINDIIPNKEQPRKTFDEAALQELSDSIAQHGVLQPLLVRPLTTGGYQLVAGERRWRASRLAGLKEVPVIIKELSDTEAMEIAIIENLQREDLNPIEEAEGLQALIDKCGYIQEEVATSVGKSRPAITNALRLLRLPEDVRQMTKDGDISAGHARALLAFDNEAMMCECAKQIIEKKLTVRDVEKMAKRPKAAKTKASSTGARDSFYDEVELALSEALGTKVKVYNGRSKGTLEIEFYTLDDLKNIANAIAK
ncbi:ParB/RepB/Spo0J family partition protein [uncultured Eubacterium sp.]|uniref:ParB/RepB/Spo0J family partition protein n=1 Tax=uncultured Eubacterium sp. TaxID=165185 RepID=UPI0015AAF322|nr:ParB/RepB/Spo0J family partition protein [uncultured Eubacterium sp.]